MAKFFALGTYSEESYQAFIKNPKQDRKAAVKALSNAMGAKFSDIEFLRGPYDFIATIEADYFETAAAVKMAVEAQGVGKSYDDKLLYDNLEFKLPPAGIVGVIGPNGAGKTTLFRMIMGKEDPDYGTFKIGETVKISYVDQQHTDIDMQKTIWEQITDGQEQVDIGGHLMNSRAYVAKFNFNGSDQNKKVAVLSGGERNRLHLAMTLRQEANVLLLDEPTNDLDVNTLRALEEGLNNFAGCAVIISHDRWFLDRVCTHILAFEGDSNVVYFEGSFSDYEENRKKRLGDISPQRIKYRKLKKN